MASFEQIKHDFEENTKLLPIINAFPTEKSPLLALSQKIETFFDHGVDAAFAAFQNLQESIANATYKRERARIRIPAIPDLGLTSKIMGGPHLNTSTFWRMSPAATTLVLLLACADDDGSLARYSTMKDQGRFFGGFPSCETVRDTAASASLPVAFDGAKAAALREGRTTLMVVTLHDVETLERLGRGEEDGDFFNFTHFFTIGVGPEGMMVWQAWGYNGYRFDEYLRDGHARLRTWGEADQFVGDFDKLANEEGNWTTHINDLYRKLFLVNINQVCGPDGPEPPVSPKFKAWVRIHTLDNVTYDNVTKFLWVKE
ncbi:hypothetical protein F4778DRAFT_743655 [Xylariomycetidae sp. FL2044]|nr:hypothetical protein F4778DRAFT_743655 [Xylariomycetidae sp. FL2044]